MHTQMCKAVNVVAGREGDKLGGKEK